MAKKAKPGNTVTDPQRLDGECDPNKVPNDKKEHWRREAVSFLCDLMPQVEIPGTYDFGELRMPVVSHADVARMLPLMAEALDIDKIELARRFANAWVPRRTALWKKLWGPRYVDKPSVDLPQPEPDWTEERKEKEYEAVKDRRRKSLPRFGLLRCRHCYGNPVLSLNRMGYSLVCDDCGAHTDRARSRGMVLDAWEKNNSYDRRRGARL